ncbi:FkbM family methyltransferase [Hyalangium versicolor]|uniref:FkbM family methyltransferase n=1 Tax=Hyalangium versicolor TaxID=2861190 RepID=UPI001CCE0A2B|nr:FkbM family methyltransferase [Hyalangium versicolor]
MQAHAWYEDAQLLPTLPLYLRAYGRYLRRMLDSKTGLVRGGSFLLRRLQDLIRWRGLPREQAFQVDGLTAHVDLLDNRWLWVLGELQGKSAEARLIEQTLGPGGTLLDIGANHGSYTLLAGRRVGPTGRVVAFEPQPILARLVRQSLASNGMKHGTVHELALGEQAGSATFFIPATGSGSGGLYASFSGRGQHERLEVRVARLDELLPEPLPRENCLVKMDCEGGELGALRGGHRTLSALPPLLLELNAAAASAAGYSLTELRDELQALGYRHFSELSAPSRTEPLATMPLVPLRNVIVRG